MQSYAEDETGVVGTINGVNPTAGQGQSSTPVYMRTSLQPGEQTALILREL